MTLLQKVFDRAEAFRYVSNRLYKTDSRFGQEPIVVHDRNQWSFNVLTFLAQVRFSLNSFSIKWVTCESGRVLLYVGMGRPILMHRAEVCIAVSVYPREL
jgi:hypothetical protein